MQLAIIDVLGMVRARRGSDARTVEFFFFYFFFSVL